MFDFRQLHHVFPADVKPPYDRALQQEIEAHRRSYDGVLFIDRVLKALGITKAKVYPPKSPDALRQLHHQICEASMSTHHKLSLFYYVLLDFDHVSVEDAISEQFAASSGMPRSYQIFMKGLWYLDRQDFQTALEYVAHPSLSPDFADDIIVALVRHAPDGDYTLALSYFHAVQPILKTSAALDALFGAMARTNASEALLYTRTYPEHTREALFQKLLGTILESESETAAGASSANELAFLPLDELEEGWFEEYLMRGDGRGSRRAKELVLVRKIACDQFDEVARQRVGGQWGAILQGIKSGIAGQE